jgi:pantetheine-phosphate adenylyltransferase
VRDGITAVYPGTFDPVTLGHNHVVLRAAKLFARVVVAVNAAHQKNVLFTLGERLQMTLHQFKEYDGVSVEPFDGLLRDFVVTRGAKVIIRGLRTTRDCEYEFQLAAMNRLLMPQVETIFLAPRDDHQFVSSTYVREIAMLGGDVQKFVSSHVSIQLRGRVQSCGRSGQQTTIDDAAACL